jgi:ribonuclease J
MEELQIIAAHAIDQCVTRRITDWATIKNTVKNELSGYLYKKTKRNPMILPIIMEV